MPKLAHYEIDVLKELVRLLSSKEKSYLVFILITKIIFISFDLAGILMVGAVISVISGTVISNSSLIGQVLIFLKEIGLANQPAGLLLFAITFFCLKGTFSILLGSVVGKFSSIIEIEKSFKIFERTLGSGIGNIESFDRPTLALGLTSGISTLITQAIFSISTIFGEMLLIIVIAIVLAFANLQLFIALASFFILISLFLQKFVSKAAVAKAESIHKSNLLTQTLVNDFINNFRFISSSGLGHGFTMMFMRHRRENAVSQSKYQNIVNLPRYVMEISVMLAASIVVAGIAIFGDSELSAATVGIFAAGIFRFVSSLLPLQSAIVTWKRSAIEAKPTLDLAKSVGFSSSNESRLVSKSANPLFEKSPLEVAISGVCFRHPGNKDYVFTDLNFRILPGQFVALQGTSGSGKSTLADLIMGLREPSKGEILLNGIPATTYIRENPGRVGYMPQATHLVSGSLFQNISLDFSIPSEDQLTHAKNALLNAGLGNLLESFQNGLETQLSGGERQLSGGQLQRLGLARIYYLQPDLIILDEPISALDNQNAKHVLSALNSLRGQATIILIAHSDVSHANLDMVIELDSGEKKTQI